MKRELYLLRHAKALERGSEMRDADRPLKPRGIADVLTVAGRIDAKTRSIERILSSPANRAIHTAILFAEATGIPLDRIVLYSEIYLADDDDLVHIVSEVDNRLTSLMIVGHNPSVTNLANRFLNEPVFDVPTSGLVALQFDADSWMNISKSTLADSFTVFP
jgi:phosphohistidine phosphatase